METLIRDCKLDDEWVSLLKEAKELGLSVEEVKSFLNNDHRKKKMV
ncbi:anti-repressor SinI family protein [Halobacillus sp. SY10]